MVTSRRRRGPRGGRRSGAGTQSGVPCSPAQAQRSWMPEEVPSISGRGPRGEGGGGGGVGRGKNGVGASAVLEAANPVNPGVPGSERRLRGLGAGAVREGEGCVCALVLGEGRRVTPLRYGLGPDQDLVGSDTVTTLRRVRQKLWEPHGSPTSLRTRTSS